MREIKFRGLTIQGEWIYFTLHELASETEVRRKFQFVRTETISEYTGKRDSKGTEVYEGDLFITGGNYVQALKSNLPVTKELLDALKREDEEFVKEEGTPYGLVEWTSIGWSGAGFAYINDGVVVGNKWDNPELLK